MIPESDVGRNPRVINSVDNKTAINPQMLTNRCMIL